MARERLSCPGIGSIEAPHGIPVRCILSDSAENACLREAEKETH
jgi:hypothetical protein